MTTTTTGRRGFARGLAAGAALVAAPGLVRAQAARGVAVNHEAGNAAFRCMVPCSVRPLRSAARAP